MLALWLFASAASAATVVNFQGRNYIVSTIAVAAVASSGAADMMFVNLSGQPFLTLPTDPTLRGDFDNNNAEFLVLDSALSGNINVYSRVNGNLINLNGTLGATMNQSPDLPITTISKPLINGIGADVCVIDDNTLGYRVDDLDGDQAVYIITRQISSTVINSFVPDLAYATEAMIAYDPTNGSLLLTQQALSPTYNTDTSDRISAYTFAQSSSQEGTTTTLSVSELVLTGNANVPGWQQGPAGLTVDPSTGTIYLLDNNTAVVYVFTPQLPTLVSVTPNTGTLIGGTQVVIKGTGLPPNSQVFFGGVAATNVTFISSTKLTATTPAHALGAVDITLTGTGIPTGTPVTLPSGFTYIAVPPVADLSASPTSGPPPLAVAFNVNGTSSPDATVAACVLDFGDGSPVFTFPPSLTVVDTSHTYATNGTFTATLTVTDSLGVTSTATQTIVVGTGGADVYADLVLRELNFTLKDISSDDTVSMRAQILPPTAAVLTGATLTISFGPASFTSPLTGLKVKTPTVRFVARLLNNRAFDPNTYTFTFTEKKASLRAALATGGLDLNQNGLGQLNVVAQFVLATGRLLQFSHPAVVDVSIRGGLKVKLVRP